MPTSYSRSQSPRFLLTLALAFSLTAGNWPRPQHAAGTPAPDRAAVPAQVPAEARAETEDRAREAYGKLGVSFEENRGQADGRVRFLARHGGATVFLTQGEASFVLSAAEAPASASAGRDRGPAMRATPKSHAVRMKFEGANPRAEVLGERELPGRVNYFRGSDPSKWQTNVKTYGAVRYRGIYEGIDLVYYGNESGQTEYDFVVAAGADARQISLKVEGANALKVDIAGDLVISTPAGEMRQRRPVVYQELDGARRAVEGAYLVEAGGRVRFALGEYDRSAPLVIDPVLEYSTYLGGSDNDIGESIAVDPSGNAYVTGVTHSSDFPLADAFQGAYGGKGNLYITKINAAGTALVYSTFIGGSDFDAGRAITVDSEGSAYVTGATVSPDFPLVNAFQSTPNGEDTFVLKLNAAGSALVYSTLIGGNSYDSGQGIKVDSSGNAYVAGETYSTDFPVVNPIQASGGGQTLDAFVLKLNAAGSALVYSTYLGGSEADWGVDIAIDPSGNAYVAGPTFSTDFPVANAIQSTNQGGFSDAFVAKLNAAGSALVYSTYLGGSESDGAYGIAVDSEGSAYVTGATVSPDFPLVNAFQSTAVDEAAFVTKLSADGSAFVYSTYFGGFGSAGYAITVDLSGNAYVAGDASNGYLTPCAGFRL